MACLCCFGVEFLLKTDSVYPTARTQGGVSAPNFLSFFLFPPTLDPHFPPLGDRVWSHRLCLGVLFRNPFGFMISFVGVPFTGSAMIMAVSGPKLVEAAKAAIITSASLKTENAGELEKMLNALGYSWATPEEVAKIDGSPEQEDLALAFRLGLEQLVIENKTMESIKDARIVSLMDLSVHAAMQSWVPRQLPLMVIHEMLEAQTADQCSQAFCYLEQRVDKLRQLTENGEHKYSQAALLRCCNTLMQRLSKSSSLLLCGRVLMLLAHVLPLTEKSGVNLKVSESE